MDAIIQRLYEDHVMGGRRRCSLAFRTISQVSGSMIALWVSSNTTHLSGVAVFRNKGMSGQRLATNAPYGYIKGEDGHLLVDNETAPAVELIFQLWR